MLVRTPATPPHALARGTGNTPSRRRRTTDVRASLVDAWNHPRTATTPTTPRQAPRVATDHGSVERSTRGRLTPQWMTSHRRSPLLRLHPGVTRWGDAHPVEGHTRPGDRKSTLRLHVLRRNVEGDHEAVGAFVLERLGPHQV